MSHQAQFSPAANNYIGHWVGEPETSEFHAFSDKPLLDAIGSKFSFQCPHAGCGRRLMASRVTRKEVDPIKALFLGVLGLAAAAALIYLLVHLSAILAPLGLAAWMVNGIFGITGGAAAGSLYVGLKNFAAFLSTLGTDPKWDAKIKENREYFRSDEA